MSAAKRTLESSRRTSANGSSETAGRIHADNHNNNKSYKRNGSGSRLDHFFNYTLVPTLLLTLIPNLVLILWYVSVYCDGSFLEFLTRLYNHGFVEFIVGQWTSIHIFSPLACCVILAYSTWAILLMVVVPGPKTYGPITEKGNIPVYKDNGFRCYIITMVTFCLLTAILKINGYTPTVIYDHLCDFIGTMTVFSFIFCLILYVKGHFWPSTTDCGSSGNFIFDYFWGMEQYPRLFGIDVKVFTNCRFGMTSWPLLVCVYTLKSYELHGFVVDSAFVSAILQMVYVTKFFWWESGYMKTIDIKMDRAGYYICWGCLVYVPFTYTSVSMYLVNHPVILGPFLSFVILSGGMISCAMNYIADRQKQVVRSTNGNSTIWGRKPEVIRATYRLKNGETKENLLLASGFWGIARHFHYVPELALAFLWTIPALFQNLMPFTYFIYLSILLVHRTFRDDFICKEKYKEHWAEYQQLVPYRMIPFVF